MLMMLILLMSMPSVRRGPARSPLLRRKPGGRPDREPLPVSRAGGVRIGPPEVGNQRTAFQVKYTWYFATLHVGCFPGRLKHEKIPLKRANVPNPLSCCAIPTVSAVPLLPFLLKHERYVVFKHYENIYSLRVPVRTF